ncbi:MAG: thiamine pyrophosphate-dependent enzyme [Nitrososphaerota archaeon]|nr:thiamine pyrophosphate-dependent enzyme [Candidatus Calditenuaceae archaeon]MDW8072728.1 thiamine pyrophosphate-dependent enzyme [Nitrososphaerota archaeon]
MSQVSRLSDLYGREGLSPGHSACRGCGATVAVRQILLAAEPPFIVVTPTGCLEVISSQFPYTSWRVPWVHVAFENAAAVASGIEAALRALERKGLGRRHKVIVIAGDGGTFDIGFQALSGAFERGHDLLYICYDNEAYMNTGIQRSAATPLGSATTTTPAGKREQKKDIVSILVGHGSPYVATSSPHLWKDLTNKVRKAQSIEGPTFLHVVAPCPRGWYFEPQLTIKMAKLAVETRIFPIYEVENGKYRINYMINRPRPVEEYLKLQSRFAYLLRPENAHLLERFKQWVEDRWNYLQKMAAVTSS